jgi:Holliday junction DNA helicase RuvA
MTLYKKRYAMIGILSGKVAAVHKQSVVIMAGAIGFEVATAHPSDSIVGQEITVHTHLQWSAEQGPSLFGFRSAAEKAVFLAVISCNGIGPKIGLAVLADLGVALFLEALHTGNDKILSKVSGIGTKKAEQMIVQLKHKVDQLHEQGAQLASNSMGAQWHTVAQTLESLNYSRAEIAQAMNYVKAQVGSQTSSFDVIMRQALGYLSKQV